jgi:HSP20 family protein
MNSIIRYSNPLSALSNHFDDFFSDNIFESINRELSSESWPKVDISENETTYLLKADCPGLDKKDIEISIENGILKIEGEKKVEHKKEKGKYYHLERSYGKFCRSFYLPENIDQEQIVASMKNGVLELAIPKVEKARPKSIDIKID